jgi:hypothetical protein
VVVAHLFVSHGSRQHSVKNIFFRVPAFVFLPAGSLLILIFKNCLNIQQKMVFGRSNRPLPQGEGDPNSYTISQQQSLVSLSELNNLLESALRMSGEDAASMLGGPPPAIKSSTTDDSESTSSSWRLDTTRKLTAVSMDLN